MAPSSAGVRGAIGSRGDTRFRGVARGRSLAQDRRIDSMIAARWLALLAALGCALPLAWSVSRPLRESSARRVLLLAVGHEAPCRLSPRARP